MKIRSSKFEGRRSQHSSQRGAALIAVMWVIFLLITLVTTTMVLLQNDAETNTTRQQMFRARCLAEAGLAIASHNDVRPEDSDLLRREVSEGEGYIVTMKGEDGRLNPNALLAREDRATLGRIFRAWGLKQDQSFILIDSLLDWVDNNPFANPQGAEASWYLQRQMPGMPFNRPFKSLEEISLVRGMADVQQLYPNWRDWFSIHSNGMLDVNEASAEVLSAVTGADRTFAQQFVARRAGRDGIPHTEDDAPYQDINSALRALGVGANPAFAQLLSTQSSITRIESTGIVGDFRRTLVVVINRGLALPQPGVPPGAVVPGGGAPPGGGGFGPSLILEMHEEDSKEKGNFAAPAGARRR